MANLQREIHLPVGYAYLTHRYMRLFQWSWDLIELMGKELVFQIRLNDHFENRPIW